MVINGGRPLAEYLQIEYDQVDNEDMGDTDAPSGITRGVVVSWINCLGCKLRIFRSTFVFPSMPPPNLIRYHCTKCYDPAMLLIRNTVKESSLT